MNISEIQKKYGHDVKLNDAQNGNRPDVEVDKRWRSILKMADEVYRDCKKLQADAIKMYRPGIDGADVQKKCRDISGFAADLARRIRG